MHFSTSRISNEITDFVGSSVAHLFLADNSYFMQATLANRFSDLIIFEF